MTFRREIVMGVDITDNQIIIPSPISDVIFAKKYYVEQTTFSGGQQTSEDIRVQNMGDQKWQMSKNARLRKKK